MNKKSHAAPPPPHEVFGPATPHIDIATSRSGSNGLSSRVHLSAHSLYKQYRKGQVSIPVLGGVDLEVAPGEFLSIIGQSGSGKSTLLHLLGTLDQPDRGEVHFGG